MRTIADEAGVALGNTYYYFRSKDDLVHAFYERLQSAQLAASESILLTEKNLKNRLSGVIRAQLALFAPYQRMFISLFKIAADPESPLNPFHAETKDLREACISRYQELVEGSSEKISDDLRKELPVLIWMYDLAIVLYWIHDRSPNHRRTYLLLELSSDIVCNLISLASVPFMAPLRKSVLQTLDSLRQIQPDS
jgi:AcrR family transcriptional regulator